MTAAPKPRPSNDDRIRAALWFAAKGFGIFPVWSARANGVCRCPEGAECTSPGKHPLNQRGFKEATTDPDKIRTFLSTRSEPNYGMVPPDGVFILDVDTDEERERLTRLAGVLGTLPATLTDQTANGEHLFYRWPEGIPRPLRKMFGLVNRWGSGQQQGYVIGPRSVHSSGAEYVPAVAGVWDIATLPEDWARAAIASGDAPAPSGTVRLAEEQLPEPGGRHDWLRDRARAMAGVIRDPEVLLQAVLAENARLSQPKSEDEVRRAIGEVLERFPADPLHVIDEESGQTEPVSYSEPGHTTQTSDDDHFPGPMNEIAFSGVLGECVKFLEEGTDASRVGLLASMVSFCGALMPARTYWHGMHTSSPYLALVGKQGIGRKGTAMFRVRDALAHALEPRAVEDIRFEGLASGEALVKALLDRDRETNRNPTGILFEEEYESFLAASGREGSTLDSRMRAAFDGKQLSHRKVAERITVAEPYWLSGLVGITPSALRRRYPQENFDNGSGTRWLWLPVQRRDVRVASQEPILPPELSTALVKAYQANVKTQPRIDPGPGVEDLLSEYDEYLRSEVIGTAAKLTVRYGVIALRIALVHAAVSRSKAISRKHVRAAIAMTEYARAGIRFCFGDTATDIYSTHLYRLLLDSETGELPQHILSKWFLRDFVKRQTAIDGLVDLGLATVEKVKTKGRNGTVVRLVARKRDFSDFSALFGPEPKEEVESTHAHPRLGEGAEKRGEAAEKGTPERADHAEKGGEEKVVYAEVAEALWIAPCTDYSGHRNQHRRVDGKWMCETCSLEVVS
jgi:hypothetical protein